MDIISIEALSVAAFADALAALPHDARAYVTATEHGTPWAIVSVSPMTDTLRAVFPLLPMPNGKGCQGDTRKRGQAGVSYRTGETGHVRTVVERARRMHSQ